MPQRKNAVVVTMKFVESVFPLQYKNNLFFKNYLKILKN